MNPKVFWLITGILLAFVQQAEAQQADKIPRIGFLINSPSVFPGRTGAFRQGLRELGYVEGKNLVIEWRSTEGKLDRAPTLATELVRLKVDILVSAGPTSTAFLKEATTTIPIVMGFDTDPVGNGLVASLARPGSNVTGLSVLSPELGGKRLELLKEIIPKLSRIAVVGSSTLPGNAQTFRETELAAEALRVTLLYDDVLSPKDIEAAFQRAFKGRADAVLALGNSVLNAYRAKVADLAVKNRLPAMYYAAEFVEDGGLISYGVDFPDLFRRAATYVDKILKGAKPAELPVEQPTKFELVINLKTAKQIGLIIPPNVLARADKVIR
jgi:ABC-type uncharacterized transport system substrate-binding protein